MREPPSPPPGDIHVRIENAMAILAAELPGLGPQARNDVRLAVDTLQAAAAAITGLEQELDLVTAPDLDAAEEVQRLRRALETAERRAAALEQRLADLQDELSMETGIHAEERRRLAALERRTKEMEEILGTDEAAFGRFMDHALDEDQKKGRIQDR